MVDQPIAGDSPDVIQYTIPVADWTVIYILSWNSDHRPVPIRTAEELKRLTDTSDAMWDKAILWHQAMASAPSTDPDEPTSLGVAFGVLSVSDIRSGTFEDSLYISYPRKYFDNQQLPVAIQSLADSDPEDPNVTDKRQSLKRTLVQAFGLSASHTLTPRKGKDTDPVSYTHLTLPTKRIV